MALTDQLGRDTTKILVGGAEVFIGAKTSNGAAGVLFSFGYTQGPVEFMPNYEDLEVDAEQAISVVNSFTVGAKFMLAFTLLQNTLQAMRVGMRLASGNLTGTAPGTLLTFNDPTDEYFQLKFNAKGAGSLAVDPYVYWNVKLRMDGALPFAKRGVQALKMLAAIYPDSTITGVPEFAKGLYGNRAVT